MKEKQKFINAFNYSDKIRIVKQHKKNFLLKKILISELNLKIVLSQRAALT